MTRFFTHFWPDDLCNSHYREGLSGTPVEFTAGSGFVRKAVASGDIIYIISVYDGQFLLLGKLEVDRIITSRMQALAEFGPGIENAKEYVRPVEDTVTPLQFTRQIAWETVGELRFIGLDGKSKPLKLAGHEEVDAATLTGVRELTSASAALLDEALNEPFEDVPRQFDEEDDEEIDDSDLSEIELLLPDEKKSRLLHEAAINIAVKEFQAAGWVVHVNDTSEPRLYDILCSQDAHDLTLAVIGIEGSELIFTFREMQYILAERDSHYAVCIVTKALSKLPTLATFTSDDLHDLFDARPLIWAFRPRADDDFGQEDFE